MPLISNNFVAVFEKWCAVRSNLLKFRCIFKQLIAGCDKNPVTIKRNAPQAPIPASSLPVDIGGIPIDGLSGLPQVEIKQVNATVALTLAAAANN